MTGRKRFDELMNNYHVKFRIDQAYGNVYEWNEDAKEYTFLCKLAVFDKNLVESPATTPAEDLESMVNSPHERS